MSRSALPVMLLSGQRVDEEGHCDDGRSALKGKSKGSLVLLQKNKSGEDLCVELATLYTGIVAYRKGLPQRASAS